MPILNDNYTNLTIDKSRLELFYKLYNDNIYADGINPLGNYFSNIINCCEEIDIPENKIEEIEKDIPEIELDSETEILNKFNNNRDIIHLLSSGTRSDKQLLYLPESYSNSIKPKQVIGCEPTLYVKNISNHDDICIFSESVLSKIPITEKHLIIHNTFIDTEYFKKSETTEYVGNILDEYFQRKSNKGCLNNAFEEDNVIEINTKPVNSKEEYIKLCKEIVDLVSDNKKYLYLYNISDCNGGNHIQIDAPFISELKNILLFWNLTADLANYPEIAYFFNDPIDDENAEPDTVSMDYVFNNNYLNDSKYRALTWKRCRKTMEFRFFDMWETLDEAEFQIDFLYAWINHNMDLVKKNIVKPMSKNNISKHKKSKEQIIAFMDSIGIQLDKKKHKKFFWNLKEKFYYHNLDK